MESKKCDKTCKCSQGLYKIYCQDCGRFLCEGPASSWTYCPACRRWSRIEPEEGCLNG